MPDFEMLYPGRFLKKSDLAEPTTVRIVEVTAADLSSDEVGPDGKREKAKGLLRFKARPGSLGAYAGDEMILCKTNAALIAAALGERDFAKWGGKLITLYHDPSVRFGRETTGGIRVYGSPELASDKRVELKRPRRTTPEVYHLHATGKKQEPAATPTPAKEQTA